MTVKNFNCWTLSGELPVLGSDRTLTAFPVTNDFPADNNGNIQQSLPASLDWLIATYLAQAWFTLFPGAPTTGAFYTGTGSEGDI
jgi:hypothetical protein